MKEHDIGIKREFRWFREDLCDRCGECFRNCPVLNLPELKAKEDIEALIAGTGGDSLAFRHCTTCNICDFICPRGADPYELILERFSDYRSTYGLPYLAKMIFPNEPENIWSGLRLLMDEDELSMLRKWEENLHSHKKEILLTGFYTNIVPYLAGGNILDELHPIIAGSKGLWGCGGDSNKLGLTDLTEQVIELVQRQFAAMGVKRVYCFMEAEAAMLAEVLPRRFGADFTFEVLPLDYWVLEKLEKRDIKIVKSLNFKATVHDNCMSRYLNCKPQEVVRRIVEATGCQVIEMQHNRLNALCCGWAATIPTLYGANSNNPLRTVMYLFHSLYRRLQEATETGADVMIVNCPACYIFLSVIKELTNARINIYHPLEIVEMAAGEACISKTKQRSWDILAVATNLLLMWVSSRENRKRFFPKPIDTSRIDSLPTVPEKDAKRIEAIARFYKGPVIQNRVSRAMIGALTKSSIALYRIALRRKLGNYVK